MRILDSPLSVVRTIGKSIFRFLTSEQFLEVLYLSKELLKLAWHWTLSVVRTIGKSIFRFRRPTSEQFLEVLSLSKELLKLAIMIAFAVAKIFFLALWYSSRLLIELLARMFEAMKSAVGETCSGPLLTICRETCLLLDSQCFSDPRRTCRGLSGLWHPDRQTDAKKKESVQNLFFKIRAICEAGAKCYQLRDLFLREGICR